MANKLNLPVLVLNANYEPLNVCNIRRAVGLLLNGRAEMVSDGRGVIRTPSTSYPCPSIIRLERMVKRPRPTVKLNKREVFRRDAHTCQYCGKQLAALTIDHVKPRHRGGKHTWSNVVAACPQCNRRKGGKTLQEARMALRHPPRRPRATAVYLYGRYLDSNANWREFLEGW